MRGPSLTIAERASSAGQHEQTSIDREPTVPQHGGDFAVLSRVSNQHGLLDRRPGSCLAKFAVYAVLLTGGWTAFAVLGSSWWQVATAAFLALVHTQLAFIGHGAGHKQIFTGKRANDVVGYLHAGLVGMSYGWWHGKHHRHHTTPPPVPSYAEGESAPRPTLVQQFCVRGGVPYSQTSLLGSLPTGAKSPVRHRRATAPDERTMTITETTTVAPTTRNGRVAVHTVCFSHPALDTPAFRWAAAPPGAVQAPRDVPLLFLAPCGDERLA